MRPNQNSATRNLATKRERNTLHQKAARQHHEASLIRQIWSTTTRPLRMVALSIASIGIILLTIGIMGDINDWFSSLPFLTNIISGITSACFGIPLALVFLQWLTSLQGEELRKRSIMRLRVKLSREFQASISAPVRSGDPDDLEALFLKYANTSQPWRTLDESLNELIRTAPGEYSSAIPCEENSSTRRARTLLESYLEELSAASTLTRQLLEPEPKNWQTRVKTQWETLESSLRNESLQAGLNWIPAELETEIESLMASIDISRMYSVHDISQTIDLYRHQLDSPLSSRSMMGIQANGYIPGFASDYITQLRDLMVHTKEVVALLSQDK
jgi:hypothetical protein